MVDTNVNGVRGLSQLAQVVEEQQRRHPERVAFVFEDDAGQSESITYGALAARARTLAGWLSRRTSRGDRALLVYPPGLEFIAGFLGCVYAGVLPVPATYPKPRRPSPRINSIVEDCRPSLVLTHSSVIAGLCLDQQSPAISELTWEASDKIPTAATADFQFAEGSPDDLAFLQYTSGSTAEPRGVMVSHGNILSNLEAIRAGFDIKHDEHAKAVFWLPAYHDMGLIGGILTPLYVGGTATLIAPTTFLRTPLRWLELISLTGAAISGSPNFGYDLAVRKSTEAERAALDLRAWRLAFCGAEPINPQTLDDFAAAFSVAGFTRGAFYPCYGLAESTLLVSGGQSPTGPNVLHVDRETIGQHKIVSRSEANAQTQSVVSCGRPCHGIVVAIVDPQTRKLCAADEIGEIWTSSTSVAQGYWNKPELDDDVFRATIADGHSGSREYLRTGDLGFLHDGELYVTGRIKDLIIVRGRNLYPQDVERTALSAHEAVDAGAAFALSVNGREELAIVHQLQRTSRHSDSDEVVRAIRNAVAAEHEVDPHAIVLIRPAALPMTSSGKVQRQHCRELYVAGVLPIIAEWVNPTRGEFPEVGGDLVSPPSFLNRVAELSPDQLKQELYPWLESWLTQRTNLPPGTITPTTPFAHLGIDSLTAVEISQELDQLLGLHTPPMVMWSCPTPAALADFLVDELQVPAIR